MPKDFDPYLQWLGIRDSQRPPNHYRLLGLELFESDANVIAMSADRQMAHLRNFKTGPEADLAQQLLNELTAARLCLLKAERKAAYDNQLRAVLKPALPPKSLPIAVSPAMPVFPSAVVASGSNSKYAKPAAKASWKPWAILASLVFLGVSLTILLINKNSPAVNESVAVSEKERASKSIAFSSKTKLDAAVKPVNITPVTTNTGLDSEVKIAEGGGIKNRTAPVVFPNKNETKPIKQLPDNLSGEKKQTPTTSEQKQAIDAAFTSNVDITRLLGEELDPKPLEKSSANEETKAKSGNNPEQFEVALAPPAEAAKPARIAIPNKVMIAAKEKEIREIFADEYKSQKPEVKAALAAKLKQSSNESKDDIAMRYVLLNEARANAILGGGVKLAVELTDELVGAYDLSAGDERFGLFSKMFAGGNIPPAFYQQILSEARSTIGTLQAKDEYDVALKIVNLANAAARVQRDTAVVTEMAQRVKEISSQKQYFQRAKVAKDNIAKNPNDQAANEIWGTYLSFTKGEFQAGLPFLARGSSTDLANLANRELTAVEKPSDQLSLADDWWAYSDKLQTQDFVRSQNIRQHAGHKYLLLLPQLSGIDKVKAEKRLSELSKIVDQKSKAYLDSMITQLLKHKWTVFAPDNTQEVLIFKADGSVINRVFSRWVLENNQLLLTGGAKFEDTFMHIGTIKYNFVELEISYTQAKTIKWTAKAKIAD